MKKVFFVLTALLLGIATLSAQETKEQKTNTQGAPLVITRATASCGCTKPKYNTEPVAPGKSTIVEVTYNPAGRPGQFVKTIAIYSNGKEGAYIVRIKGVVE